MLDFPISILTPNWIKSLSTKNREIAKKNMEILIHSSRCLDSKCGREGCRDYKLFKKVIEVHLKHQQPFDNECISFLITSSIHAFRCRTSDCHIPFCNKTRLMYLRKNPTVVKKVLNLEFHVHRLKQNRVLKFVNLKHLKKSDTIKYKIVNVSDLKLTFRRIK